VLAAAFEERERLRDASITLEELQGGCPNPQVLGQWIFHLLGRIDKQHNRR
jgi:hypothetical protein